MAPVPLLRIATLNDQSPNSDGEFVLYWMTAFRRVNWNFSLQRAVELAKQYGKPLLILEALRSDYRWASDRIHRFVIDGMIDNQRSLAQSCVTYYPYIEPTPHAGDGLLTELGKRAVAVVTDDFPCFFLPRMIRAVALRCPVAMEAIDSNGIYPMSHTDRVFSRAHYFRRHLQKNVVPFLEEFPEENPLAGKRLPKLDKLNTSIQKRWPAAKLDQWESGRQSCPICRSIMPSPFRKSFRVARPRPPIDWLRFSIANWNITATGTNQNATSQPASRPICISGTSQRIKSWMAC